MENTISRQQIKESISSVVNSHSGKGIKGVDLVVEVLKNMREKQRVFTDIPIQEVLDEMIREKEIVEIINSDNRAKSIFFPPKDGEADNSESTVKNPFISR